MLLQSSSMWRKPGEKADKKLEEGEWQEPSTAPIGLLELVICLGKKYCDWYLYSFAVQICLKPRLLPCCIWSGVGPLWWSWGTDLDGNVWGDNTGDQLLSFISI